MIYSHILHYFQKEINVFYSDEN